jgi:general secretion pathway protein G
MAKTGIFEREAIVMVAFLLALPVMSLIAMLVTTHVIGRLSEAETKAAQLQIENLKGRLELYRIETGGYPSEATGLNVLVERPPEAERWNGPYLREAEELIDPWGRPYVYHFPGKHHAFDLYSFGRDGREGGEGEDRDVTSWD